MKIIKMYNLVGDFAENKDIARDLRERELLPSLENDQPITFDFENVTGATQSFIHALVSDALRKFPETAYDNIFFKNANEEVQKIITIVYSYMQESL